MSTTTEPIYDKAGLVTVRLIGGTLQPTELIEQAGRICYNSQGRHDPDIIGNWIAAGHESVLEHAAFTFLITCSRVVSHEMVRHRLAAYSQRSQRYVLEKMPQLVVPPEVPDDMAAAFLAMLRKAHQSYLDCLEAGIPREIARYQLPNATLTTVVATWNIREVRHILRLRMSPRAQPEFQAIAKEIYRLARLHAPLLFPDFE